MERNANNVDAATGGKDIFDNRGSTNSIQGAPGEPRTWAVTVKRRF